MANSQFLAERVSDLERTVERLNLHVSYLENRLAKTHRTNHPLGFWKASIWPRLAWRRDDDEGRNRPVRENRRKLDHAIHSN
jgi:hypothetical protein